MSHPAFGTKRSGARSYFAQQFCFFVMFTILGMSANAAGGGSSGPSYSDGKANYYALDPAFLVNIQGQDALHFMQIKINIMTKDTSVIKAIEKHPAPIRHELLMLFSSQQLESVWRPNDRESMRQEALSTINTVLKTYANISAEQSLKDSHGNEYQSGVRDLYFTDFVIQ